MIKGWLSEINIRVEHGNRHIGVPGGFFDKKAITLTMMLNNITQAQIEELKIMAGGEVELLRVRETKQKKPDVPKLQQKNRPIKLRG